MSKVARKKTSSPKLEDFPPEIFGEISKALTPESMKSLASTSTTIYGKSEYMKAESRRQVALQRRWNQYSQASGTQQVWRGVDRALSAGDEEVILWRFQQPLTYDDLQKLLVYIQNEMWEENENKQKGNPSVNPFRSRLGKKVLTLINKKIIQFFNS